MENLTLPKPGHIASLRQRTYLVEEIVKPERKADSTLVRLSCIDDDNQGQPLEVLWEKEIDPKILSEEAWSSIGSKGFDESGLFAAYLNTLKWNCVTATDPKLFQSPFRAGIRLDAYQLEPLRKALLLPRVNLFIADDVGLGKTIEAGLIARELLLRKKARNIVVSCPPSMLLQWKEELEARFGLNFEILDREYLMRVRKERGFSVNPWGTHSRFLVSHRLLIDENYAAPLRDYLGTFLAGSLLILDEAHHAAPSSGQKYAIDSKITRAIRDLAPRFEHRLFLSATPHNGHSNSFTALLEILDPQRFCRGVPVTAANRDAVVVRRIKEDIRAIQGGFPERKVVQESIAGLPENAPELRLSKLLNEYGEVREQHLDGQTRHKQAAAGLLMVNLQKRLLSSIEAFAKTLKVHKRTMAKQWDQEREAGTVKDTIIQNDLLKESVDSDDDRATLDEDQLAAEYDAQVEAATAASALLGEKEKDAEFIAKERDLLDQMEEIAEQHRGQNDAKVLRLIEWIKEHQCHKLGKNGAEWEDTRVIIFTEYDDTKRYLRDRLEIAIEGSDQFQNRIEIFHGPTPIPKREEIKLAFNASPKKHPVRILLATDAAREGLNLQAHCHHLFHFDVPWNPGRMEQRNGRIDRKLQPSSEVFCHYFVYEQRPEDTIIQTLIRKTDTIREELGSLSQVIDSRLIGSLAKGIRHKNIEALKREIEATDIDKDMRTAIEEDLEAGRDRQAALREQIERLRTQLDRSKKTIGLENNQFRAAISSALQLMGADKLSAIKPSEIDEAAEAFRFPALDERAGSDPTWAETMDTLRAPRKRNEKLWDWRKSSPIRDVVFEDTGRVGGEFVHLHLEQRVIQRLLGRFSAQGFVHHDLSRACFAQSQDAIPRVILLGRLALYGSNAARLHEELVPVTARWTDAAVRKEPLAPYARDAESKTLSLLDKALEQKTKQPNETVVGQLESSARQDIDELLSYLESRSEEYAADARAKLKARGEAEAKAMKEILENQQKRITQEMRRMEKLSPDQMRLDFGEDQNELRQVEANKRYWVQRAEELKEEIRDEPGRVQALYDVKATRIEPVGLIYLWPTTG